ncbi:hypothetical protein C8R43DRAFT_1114428 [Mycena crocata]|nr:hypothetical protein C8R43DRAFT_1114428 [Mycena crocata]
MPRPQTINISTTTTGGFLLYCRTPAGANLNHHGRNAILHRPTARRRRRTPTTNSRSTYQYHHTYWLLVRPASAIWEQYESGMRLILVAHHHCALRCRQPSTITACGTKPNQQKSVFANNLASFPAKSLVMHDYEPLQNLHYQSPCAQHYTGCSHVSRCSWNTLHTFIKINTSRKFASILVSVMNSRSILRCFKVTGLSIIRLASRPSGVPARFSRHVEKPHLDEFSASSRSVSGGFGLLATVMALVFRVTAFCGLGGTWGDGLGWPTDDNFNGRFLLTGYFDWRRQLLGALACARSFGPLLLALSLRVATGLAYGPNLFRRSYDVQTNWLPREAWLDHTQ